jgi:hypothetical protein
MSAWQPIETAPKDETPILVYFKDLGVHRVFWTSTWSDDLDKHGLWHVTDNKFEARPLRGYCHGDDTHWMPLPEPPHSAQEPAPECDPWCAHCAKRREQAKESEQLRADVRRGKEILLSKPEPAPAPTERVCRHDRYVGGICDSCGEPWGGHDRACRPGERR